MKFIRVVVGELQENCYILVNENNEAIVIDPGDEKEKILDVLSTKKVVGLLVTHYHFDHIGALDYLKDKYGLQVNVIPKGFQCEMINTPGHTKDSKSFCFRDINAIFVGDFIFKGSIGRTDLGGNNEEMKKSIKMFLDSDLEDMILYPGHGESTTIRDEKDNLEYFLNTL